MPTCVAFGDTHFPFAHKGALQRALRVVRDLKPDLVVQVGDLYDLFSFSRFPRSHNVMTPKRELEIGRADAAAFWKAVRAAAGKKARLHQLIGNHDERIVKRVMEALPEFEPFLVDVHRRLWEFDDVTTQPSERDELVIGGICYMHGFRSKLGDHAWHNRMSTVTGHSHVGGVIYHRLGNRTTWELNAGYLGNPYTRPLSYGMQRRFARWTHGVGVIDERGPRFIPL